MYTHFQFDSIITIEQINCCYNNTRHSLRGYINKIKPKYNMDKNNMKLIFIWYYTFKNKFC